MIKDILAEIPDLPCPEHPKTGVTLSRVSRKLFVEALKRLPTPVIRAGFLADSQTSALVDRCLGKINRRTNYLRDYYPLSENFLDTPRRILADNLVVAGKNVFLTANRPVHPDMWMRDSALVSPILDDPDLEAKMIRVFEKRQRPNGQLPTVAGILGEAPWHFADDETNLHYLIWCAKLKKDTNGEFAPNPQVLEKVMGFVRGHVHEDWYVTPAGARRGWLDSFIYERADVNTQNQGLFAVALGAADRLGVNLHRGEGYHARENYRALAVHGFLPFSYHYSNSPDASVLYPEKLALDMYQWEMLNPQIVETTIQAIPRSNHGFKILTKSPAGEYFDAGKFLANYQPGEYQNGGVWLFWQDSLLEVGEKYGQKQGQHTQDYLPELYNLLERSQWAESIMTGGQYEDVLTPRCPNHVWNLATLA